MEDDGDFVYMPSEQGYFTSATLDAISAKLKQMNKLSLDEIFRRYNKPKDTFQEPLNAFLPCEEFRPSEKLYFCTNPNLAHLHA
jgi:hypothetical protein